MKQWTLLEFINSRWAASEQQLQKSFDVRVWHRSAGFVQAQLRRRTLLQ